MTALRKTLYTHLDAGAWPKQGISPLNFVIIVVILLAVALAVASTENAFYLRHKSSIDTANTIFLTLFTIEYLMRFWSEAENPAFMGKGGRLRWMISLPALIDLAAILPVYLGAEFMDFELLRIMRLVRIATVLPSGPFKDAMGELKEALSARKLELLIACGAAFLMLFTSATVLYYAERHIQPEQFGSIPRALWWGVATMTTVGYGDVVPTTAIGKVCAGVFALGSIAIIAMPTGIVAAAFSDAFQKKR